MRVVPLAPRGTQVRIVQRLPPQGGRELGVHAHDVVALRVMPLGSVKSLRHRMCFVSQSDKSVEERDVPPRLDTRRRAFIHELRLFELPP